MGIQEIASLISSAITVDSSSPQSPPAPLIAFGGANKKGLSAREIAKKIISRKPEAGAPVGPLPDGSDSVEEKVLYIIVQEIIEHLIKNGKITVSIPPGTPVTAAGVGADGVPVTVQGMTTGFATGYAVLQ